MSKLKITTLIGADVSGSGKKAEFELGARGTTTDGKTAQYVQTGAADIEEDTAVTFADDGTIEEAADGGAAQAKTVCKMKAHQYGWVVLLA